ncbi:hypothetical protein OESDEN_15723 [Oesophagostomum dentatum]|uniref:ET module n=1 Tax=Oesophagostomum dentatum TaxID=61180 RepID=A0A0B1SKZ8_OESDE|nr:hypothetical protein OESDEN_15723 [Oesophagostomum dentatum]
MDCPGSRYCEKKSASSGGQTANVYYCGSDAECSKEGCTTEYKVTSCCCSKELCNGSTKLPAFLALVPVALGKIFF